MTKTSTVSKIQLTSKQREALALLRDPANLNIMLVGGARSGKTFLFLDAQVYMAQKYPGSRHLAARLRFNHAKASLWLDTLPKILARRSTPSGYVLDKTDHYVRFANGSELWIDGLDDKDRVDKILGREYCTIFFNEISQVAYDTVTTVLTRLSQNVDGARNWAGYDLNPAGNLHWANQLFIKGLKPDGGPAGEGYAWLQMNPYDNEENLAPGFIQKFLETLPEHKRRRFLDGEWSDPEGTIFQAWREVEEIPEEVRLHSRRAYGLDFGYSVDPAALVDLYLNGDDLYVDELLYSPGWTNQDLSREMEGLIDDDVMMYADSAEPKSIEELRQQGYYIDGATKGQDSVRVGIDWLLSKNVYVTSRSQNIWNEQANYTWKIDNSGRNTGKPIDDYNHAIDAIRYGCSDWIEALHGRVADWSASDLGL